MDKDLAFISGSFFEMDFPKDKQYLLHYFITDLQRACLKYIITFGDVRLFRQHTGCWCVTDVLNVLLRRYKKLTTVYDEAKKSLSEEGMRTVWELENGTYRVK
jgi:hypothetical protein